MCTLFVLGVSSMNQAVRSITAQRTQLCSQRYLSLNAEWLKNGNNNKRMNDNYPPEFKFFRNRMLQIIFQFDYLECETLTLNHIRCL